MIASSTNASSAAPKARDAGQQRLEVRIVLPDGEHEHAMINKGESACVADASMACVSAFHTGFYNFLEQRDVAHGAALRDGVRAELFCTVLQRAAVAALSARSPGRLASVLCQRDFFGAPVALGALYVQSKDVQPGSSGYVRERRRRRASSAAGQTGTVPRRAVTG